MNHPFRVMTPSAISEVPSFISIILWIPPTRMRGRQGTDCLIFIICLQGVHSPSYTTYRCAYAVGCGFSEGI